jgi:hypothetical protein
MALLLLLKDWNSKESLAGLWLVANRLLLVHLQTQEALQKVGPFTAAYT